MAFHVIEINSIDELTEWRDDWRALLVSTPHAGFFQSLDWLEVYWRHFGAEQKLRALLVIENDQLAGIVPLAMKREKRAVGSVRVLGYPLDDWASFYAPITPRFRPVLDAALSHVRQSCCDWDLFSLRWLDGNDSRGVDDTRESMNWAGFQGHLEQRDTTSVVDLDGDWAKYIQGWSSKYRSNIRRCERRLAERGEVSFFRYRPAGDQDGDGAPRFELFDDCVKVAELSWQGASETGTTLCHPSVRAFLRETHQVAASRGCLDVNLLRLNEQPIAFAYNYHFRGNVFGLRCGYDPQFARFGVGSLVFCRAIEDSFGRGDRIYDLGPGSLDCKRNLATRCLPIYQLTHFHGLRAKAQILRLKQLARRWFGAADDRELSQPIEG